MLVILDTTDVEGVDGHSEAELHTVLRRGSWDITCNMEPCELCIIPQPEEEMDANKLKEQQEGPRSRSDRRLQ